VYAWCILVRRSLNLDLISVDPEIERTLRRRLRNSVEMGDNMHADENERNRGENVIILGHLGICLHPLQQILLHV
jgi:hypothetical protein